MNLPAVTSANARLPETYEAAKQALAQCSAVDECKDWADKAAALASYAKQSQDDQLERMAQRIRARAIRRAGELLKQIEPQRFKGNQHVVKVGDRPNRTDAAREAGMSPHQAKQAVRVANVPDDDFDRQVDSPTPPTLTHLAQQGIQKRDPQEWLKGRDPKDFNRAMHFTGLVSRYARDLAKWNVAEVLPHLDDDQREEMRDALRAIDETHDFIATRI